MIQQIKRTCGDVIASFDDDNETFGRVLFRLALNKVILCCADLRDADLRGVDLRGVDLRWVDFSGADLSGANLSESDLRGTNFTGANIGRVNFRNANLREANLGDVSLITASNLNGADLREANLGESKYVSCSFTGHGECGRMLTAIKTPDDVTFFCGCFKGSLDELTDYIEKGKEELKESRYVAMNFCIHALRL